MKVSTFLHPLTALLLCTTMFNALAQQTVTTTSELLNAIEDATAGTTITIANGTYEDVSFDLNVEGTASKPFTIKALNPGQVFFEGNVNISLGGSYIILDGIIFQNPSGLKSSGGQITPIIEWRDNDENECNHCVITNIKIDSFNGTDDQKEDTFKWIFAFGQYNEISFSSFIGKNGVGSVINDNRDTSAPDYLKIHHNYFADRTDVKLDNDKIANDLDAIRIGNSTTSKQDSFSEVYENLFENWLGEIEIISNKSGHNKYYNNTFRNYRGALTLRHGTDCEVYANYFFGNDIPYSGGIRVMDADHKVYNNYIEGLNSQKTGSSEPSENIGAINLSNGEPDSDLDEYFEAKNVIIVNNTIVNCDFGIRVGSAVNDELTVPPENITIANNIMFNSSESALLEQTEPEGTSIYAGNINQDGSWDLTNGTNNNQTVASGLLGVGANFHRPISGSAAIDAVVGSYSFLTKDILDGVRSGKLDVGAEEFGANGTREPYTSDDVGKAIGFGASLTNYLNTSIDTINFAKTADNLTFTINSDLSWTITDNANWLTLSPTNGSSNETITATVTENNTEEDRTAVITITENGGILSTIINVSQSNGLFNPDNPAKLAIIDVTAMGTQEDKDNDPENSIDGEIGTKDGEYWAAESDDGSAYITFDLSCPLLVTNVDIAFLRGNIRTSYFKIATSTNGLSFTEATDVLSSSGTTLILEKFPLTTTPTAQYIRIIGYGNSNSAWNSYTEVEIYGDDVCKVLNIEENSLTSKGLVMYPLPAKEQLHILSKNNNTIGLIKLYDLKGRLMRKQKINDLKGSIDISTLSSGLYVINIQDNFGTLVIADR